MHFNFILILYSRCTWETLATVVTLGRVKIAGPFSKFFPLWIDESKSDRRGKYLHSFEPFL